MTDQRPRTDDELIELVRSIDIKAPPALRERVEEMIAAAPARRRLGLRTPASGGERQFRAPSRARPLAGALAAVSIAALLAVVLTSGTSKRHTLTLTSAAAPTLLAATTPAPTHSDHSPFLAAAVEGVRFPYLEDAFHLRSIGARSDVIGGRNVTTVFYSRGAQRIGYAIYGGVPSPASWGGTVQWQHGTKFHVTSENGTAIISWTRGGHLCVMSSRAASAGELVRLAGWTDQGTPA